MVTQASIMVTLQWVVNATDLPPDYENWSDAQLLSYIREVFEPTFNVTKQEHMPREKSTSTNRRGK